MAILPDKRAANATIIALAELYPEVFSRERWQPHRPLALPPELSTGRRLTLTDLRRLGHERKATATNQNVSSMRA